MKPRRKKVLALSSGGGHWVQLLRLRPAFADCDVTYATVRRSYQCDVDDGSFVVIADCNRSRKLRVLWCAWVILLLLIRIRPDIVISTGAAPGYFGVRLGRLMGAKTIWVDSIANVEELSMSGRMAGRYADLWLTQWQHLSREHGPAFLGSVL
jgi:UDP-N-acetylglucosamine:LPS N-acetylglucosamine transferase